MIIDLLKWVENWLCKIKKNLVYEYKGYWKGIRELNKREK